MNGDIRHIFTFANLTYTRKPAFLKAKIYPNLNRFFPVSNSRAGDIRHIFTFTNLTCS